MDASCSVFDLAFTSGAHIVYKNIPSAPYELWEFAAAQAELSPMKNFCCKTHLYSEFMAPKPLSANQSPHVYYEKLGRLFALIHLFGAGDLHAGNFFPISDTPVIIDCDVLLHSGQPYWRIAASGCLPYDDGKEYKKAAQTSPFFTGSACPFDTEGRVYFFEDYTDDIKRGYKYCATQILPQIRDEFLAKAQGARYRYLPLSEKLLSKLFEQRIVFGPREPSSTEPIIMKIMENINQLKQPKFYAEIDADTLYYGQVPISTAVTLSSDLLKYRFKTAPTQADIAIQFEDIDNAASMLQTARKKNEK